VEPKLLNCLPKIKLLRDPELQRLICLGIKAAAAQRDIRSAGFKPLPFVHLHDGLHRQQALAELFPD